VAKSKHIRELAGMVQEGGSKKLTHNGAVLNGDTFLGDVSKDLAAINFVAINLHKSVRRPPPAGPKPEHLMTKPTPASAELTVRVVKSMSVQYPFDRAFRDDVHFEVTFPSKAEVTAADLRDKCIEQNISGATEATLVVLEVWYMFARALTRPHILEPGDDLRDFGGKDWALQVLLITPEGGNCCCGLRGCRCSDPKYKLSCASCDKQYSWQEFPFVASDHAQPDKFCSECGHLQQHHDVQ